MTSSPKIKEARDVHFRKKLNLNIYKLMSMVRKAKNAKAREQMMAGAYANDDEDEAEGAEARLNEELSKLPHIDRRNASINSSAQ